MNGIKLLIASFITGFIGFAAFLFAFKDMQGGGMLAVMGGIVAFMAPTVYFVGNYIGRKTNETERSNNRIRRL